jgi:hypothetical protein
MTRLLKAYRLVFALLVLLTLASAAVAGAADETTEGPMRPGAWAIQFGIGDNFTLNSFSGGAVSVKRHSSAKVAWRAGVSFGLSDLSSDRSIETPDTTLLEEADFGHQSIGVELDRLHYFGAGPAVHPYFGYGPRAAWSSGHSSDDFYDREQDFWSAGVGAVFGAEYRASSAIGIHAEYRASFQYVSRTQEERSLIVDAAVRRGEDTSWNLSSGGVRFGLSAYF